MNNAAATSEYADLLSKLASIDKKRVGDSRSSNDDKNITSSPSSKFKNSVMRELERRSQKACSPISEQKIQRISSTRPPPPSIPPPPSSISSPPSPSLFKMPEQKKYNSEKILEIRHLRAELSLAQQTSAFRGLRCLFEKIARRELENRFKTKSGDRRVHELETMVSKRDTKIATLNKILQETSNHSNQHYHDALERIQIEATKTIHEIKLSAKKAAAVAEERYETELTDLTRSKDSEIESLREQLLKVHTEMEAMSRTNSKQIIQNKALSKHALSQSRSENMSLRSNLEVSQAKCKMLERNCEELRDDFEKQKRLEKENLKLKNEELEKSRLMHSNLRKEIQVLQKERQAMKKLLSDKDGEMGHAVKHAAEMVLIEVQRAKESAKSEIENLRNRVHEIEMERNRLSMRLESTQSALKEQRDLIREDHEKELRRIQNQHLELSQDYEKQIKGLHDLLVERDQQVQHLGEILQDEMNATDLDTGSTPRIEDLVNRVRHMQDAVSSIVAKHFEEESSPEKMMMKKKNTTERMVSPARNDVKSALKKSFNRASEIRRRQLRRLRTPLK